MLHGRGATAESISTLSRHLTLPVTAILAPQATDRSWYPYSFLMPLEQNQSALDSALSIIDGLVKDALREGIPLNQIYFLGFSQGACLCLEYTARNAAAYGGVIAFTGGLIGEKLNLENYKGDFSQMPILLTTGDPDPHVPLWRVKESFAVLEHLNAKVSLHVYPDRPHTIQHEEIELANKLILNT